MIEPIVTCAHGTPLRLRPVMRLSEYAPFSAEENGTGGAQRAD